MRKIRILLPSAICVACALPLAAAAPAPPAAPTTLQTVPEKESGNELATKYASGMESTTNGLERVIEEQANQIAIFTYMAAAMGLLITLGGFGLYRKLIKTVETAVDTRVASIIADRIDTQNSRSIQLHAAFLETTFTATKDITVNRQREFIQRARSGELAIDTPDGLSAFVKLQSDALLLPLTIVEATYALAADNDDPGALHEKIWILFAEVAAGRIRPAAMLQLITALINVLHFRKFPPVMMQKLLKFADQLREAGKNNAPLDVPDF